MIEKNSLLVTNRILYEWCLPFNHLLGMEKEIENLITENNELLATKNALNIVKDDLIAKVDELQSELTMCANEIQQREAVNQRLKSRITALEEELKRCKEDNKDLKQKLLAPKEVISFFVI